MSKFDYMEFRGGKDTELVFHAKKYTKEQAIKMFVDEYITEYIKPRRPTNEDITEGRVRYFINPPDYCSSEFKGGGGCYTYCGQFDKGSFPVWVIAFEKLRTKGA